MTDKKSTSKSKSAGSNAAPKGLGKGLSALLGDNAAVASISATSKGLGKVASKTPSPETEAVFAGAQIAQIDTISPNPYQQRVHFDEESLNDLVESIKQHGIVQPLLVRPAGKGYELIAGERRWRAAQIAGLHDVPIVEREADDQMAAEIAMIENIQRHDLSIIEEAEGYRRLIEEFKVRPLIGREDAEALAKLVEAKAMSARQVEALVASQDKPERPKQERSSDLVALEQDLAASTGFDVAIQFNAKQEKGSITIKANDLDQFDAIIAKIKQ